MTSNTVGGDSNGKRRHLRTRRIGGVIALTVIALIAIAFGIFWSSLSKLSGRDGAESIIGSFRDPKGKFPGKNRLNVLLIGTDYSYTWTNKEDPLNGARYTKKSRSDTIMVVSLDMETQKVSVLSIPRDIWVTAPDGHQGKINGIYGHGGAPLLRDTVADLLGVTPDFFVAVKPDSVKDVVDVLGGVEVETLDAMAYDDDTAGLHINLPKGRQTINGTQAIGFARYRKVDPYERDPETGKAIYLGYKDSQGNPVFKKRPADSVKPTKGDSDIRRMARQQQLIRAVTTKARTFSNLMQLDKVVNTALAGIETDMTRPQIFALAALFRSVPPDQMQTASLEGRDIKRGRTWTFSVDEEKKKAMVDWLLKGDESAANRLTVVVVRNGTDVAGAAGRAASLLREQGFDAQSDGNTALPVSGAEAGTIMTTRIVYGKASTAARAQHIARILGGGQVIKETRPEAAAEPDSDFDVTVILGRDLAPGFAAQRSVRR